MENNLLVNFKDVKNRLSTMADVKLVERKGFYYSRRADPWLKGKLTPMMQQYMQIKEENKGVSCLLLARISMRMFFDDA